MWKDYFERRRARRSYRTRVPFSSMTRSQKIAKLTKFAFLGVVGIIILSLIALPLFAIGLPSPDKIVRRQGFSTQILDRNGKVLYDIFTNEQRTPVVFNDTPVFLRQATVAIEDKNFYKHQGFDPVGIVRGAMSTLFRGRVASGSTLTQQLVKNVLLTSDQTLIRKAKELILTLQIERKYTKDQILQMYLNEAPYGGTAWGVGTAAETYFGKKVQDLNLVECAFLAGLPQSPSYYSPYSGSPKAYVARTQDVLRRMREDGYITKDQENQARQDLTNLDFQTQGASFKAPHFVQYVQKILEDRYGANVVEQGGLKVTTTLDLDLQEKAQEIVADEIDSATSLHITNGAAVVMDPQDGEILAMVGSKNFNAKDYDGQVNVTLSLRQPGSAIKPFTYVTAFKKGYTPATVVADVPTTFPGGVGQPEYKPVNYDGKYRGPIQLRYALANSINIVAVKLLAMVGIKDVLATASDMGITTLAPTQEVLNRVGLSLTLGGGEVRLLDLTDAYSPFMNGGSRVDPISILKVTDSQGKVLEENHPQKGKKVLTPEQAYLIADILSDNDARKEVFGLSSLLNIPGRQVAVKTGTTNDKRDNWAIGGTSQAVVGVWVGNNDNSPMLSVASGVSGASPIWRRIVIEALNGKPSVKFSVPTGIVTADVDKISGYRAHDAYPSRPEHFIKGSEPGGTDPVHTKLKLCKSDGKLATPSDISGGNYDEKEFIVLKEEDPTAAPGGQNKWQEGILNWIGTQTDEKYHPPTDFCGTKNPVNVEFVTPSDQSSNLPANFDIKITADSTSAITQVRFEIDGAALGTVSTYPYTYSATNIPNGIHELRAVARDTNGNESDRKINVGVGVPYSSPTPTPTATP
ncbi:MAG TPA: PBP1A family penicillin-binding protein [Patescibacteria group bacterium]